MSSTNRGSKRSPADFYATPSWCVSRLLEALALPGGEWLEPAAGDGAIIKAVRRDDVAWTAWELEKRNRQALKALLPHSRLHLGDFVKAAGGLVHGRKFAVAITNPPFRLAQPFIDACLACAEHVVMLLRLNYLATKSRWSFMRTHTPDVYVLPNRPSFVNGTTDSVEYAWFVWTQQPRSEGRLRILDLRPGQDLR